MSSPPPSPPFGITSLADARGMLASFTSSSQATPSARIAANRERRRETRAKRSGSFGSAAPIAAPPVVTQAPLSGSEYLEDSLDPQHCDDASDVRLPCIRVNHESSSQDSKSPKYQTEPSTTPLNPNGSALNAMSSIKSSQAREYPFPSVTPDPDAIPAAPRPRRLLTCDIPPPLSVPTQTLPRSDVVVEKTQTTGEKIKIVDGGVIARLKALRAAQKAADAASSPGSSLIDAPERYNTPASSPQPAFDGTPAAEHPSSSIDGIEQAASFSETSPPVAELDFSPVPIVAGQASSLDSDEKTQVLASMRARNAAQAAAIATGGATTRGQDLPRPLVRGQAAILTQVPNASAPSLDSSWLRGGLKGGKIVHPDDWSHHALSEIEERTERSSLWTRHSRTASASEVSFVLRPQPLRPLSVSSASSSRVASLHRRAQSEGSASSASLLPFDDSSTPATSPTYHITSPLRRKNQEATLDVCSESKAQFFSELETGALEGQIDAVRQTQRDALPSGDLPGERGRPRSVKRGVSPELAKKAALFATAGRHQSDGLETIGMTVDEQERRRQEREVERQRRGREREEREERQRLEDEHEYRNEELKLEKNADGLGFVLWEGPLLMPPTSLKDPLSHSDDWDTYHAVLTADAVEIRPTDSPGLFQPVLRSHNIRRVDDLQGHYGFKPFKLSLIDGGEHLFACVTGTDKVNWLMALQDVAGSSRHSAKPSSLNSESVHFSRTSSDVARASTSAFSTASPSIVHSGTSTPRSRPLPARPASIVSHRGSIVSEQTQDTSSVTQDPFRAHQTPVERRCDLFGWFNGQQRSALTAANSTRHNPIVQALEDAVIPSPNRSNTGHPARRDDKTGLPNGWRRQDPQSLQSDQDAVERDELESQRLTAELGQDSASLRSRQTETSSSQEIFHDAATITTRVGGHSPSEQSAWRRDLDRFEDDARLASLEATAAATAPPPGERKTSPALHECRDTSTRSTGRPLPLSPSERDGNTSSTAKVLSMIREDFKGAGEHIAEANLEREQIGLIVNELADVLHDSRRSNDSQFERLAGAIYEILQHINDLPDALAARLSTDPTPFLPPEMLSSEVAHHTPTHDREQHSDTASTLVDHLEAQADAAQQHQTGNRVRFEDQPRNSFVQLERSSSAAETQNKGSTLKRKGSLSKLGSVLRGPRMPGGIKIWSGPAQRASVAEHAARWGGVGRSTSRAAASETSTFDPHNVHIPEHGSVTDGCLADENLAQTLENLASNGGEERQADLTTVAHAIFEILRSIQDVSRRQQSQEQRGQEANGGLSRRELAELESKKEEIRRLEAVLATEGGRRAHLDEAIAQLHHKTDQQDTLVQQIVNAQQKQATQRPMMDPGLKEETRKLLMQVKAGVDNHVKDFRGQLTSEVQRMFREVGKLRDEKTRLQAEIAELMLFQARHSGSSSSAPIDMTAPRVHGSLKPASAGLFGPRRMR